jgi:hypothetical protein
MDWFITSKSTYIGEGGKGNTTRSTAAKHNNFSTPNQFTPKFVFLNLKTHQILSQKSHSTSSISGIAGIVVGRILRVALVASVPGAVLLVLRVVMGRVRWRIGRRIRRRRRRGSSGGRAIRRPRVCQFGLETILRNCFGRNLRGKKTNLDTGLPDFSWYKIPKRGKMYQISTNYTKCP